jgi:hypothetical protein
MTPAALIEQELATAEAAQHDGNDGKWPRLPFTARIERRSSF